MTLPHSDGDELLPRTQPVERSAVDTIFNDARSAHVFAPRPVPRSILEKIVKLAGLGPTSNNAQPVRYVFVETDAAKRRLEPALSPGNRDKTMAAPVTTIVAFDLRFYEKFGTTIPARSGAAERFADPAKAAETRAFARDNALLAMGYFIVAARALGLACGPMGGFDRTVVDAAFFADVRWASMYLMNLGFGDDTPMPPRQPRLQTSEIVRFE